MDFSLKRWGAHFCPPPIWATKKACFLPPFQCFGHGAHMFFRFLLHRFCVFLHEFCIFSHLFVKFSAWANANWQISGVITSIISELAKVQSPNKNGKSVAICRGQKLLTQGKWNQAARLLYDWYYPARLIEGAEALSPGQRPGYNGNQQCAL